MDEFTPAYRRLQLVERLLRIVGALDVSAAMIVALPERVIQSANRQLGLEPIPSEPLTWYLIRITAAMYAAYGALLLFLSSDVRRFRPVIRFLGGIAMIHGMALFSIDRSVGMPQWWCFLEGPTFAVLGLILVWLCRPNQTP